MKGVEEIKDKWLIFLIIILALYIIIKIVERSNVIFMFPFDYINDIASYMARLFFLSKYGFHASVPNWFNGQYTSFLFTGPAWYYFTLPIYNLTKNVQLATYVSLILVYIIGFVFFLILGKMNKFSLIKTTAFYLIFFANPVAIGNFIRLGKLPEMFGWVFFIPVFTLAYLYKDAKLDKKVLWLIPSYAMVLLSSQPVFIFATLMIASLFLVKTNRERIAIALAVLLVAILTAFWWYPYISNASEFYAGHRVEMWGFLFNPVYVLGDTITSFVIMPAFFLVTYFYLKSKNYSKKELLFLAPSIILAFVYFTRLVVFIPLLNKPHADSYNFFFLFLGVYLFLKTNYKEYPKAVRKIIQASLIIIPILMIAVAQIGIPPYEKNTEEDRETLEMMELVGNSGTLVILGPKSYTPPYYAYGAIHYDTRTTGGYAIEEMKAEYIRQAEDMEDSFNKKECSFIEKAKELKVDYVITYREGCNFLERCGAEEAKKFNIACMYQL